MDKMFVDGEDVWIGSGNIYDDLGLPDAEERKIRTDLAIEITLAIRRMGLTQQQAAERMGLTQPKVSELMHGKLGQFSERKLMDCLTRLGYDIEITLRPTTEPVGRFHVAFA
ncbi:hypothetical protein JCM31598_17660 [Desulfonatronum parangueonense]